MTAVAAGAFAAMAAQALQRMAFVVLDPIAGPAEELCLGPALHASVDIRLEGADGERDGEGVTFCVTATHELLAEVASAMLGLPVEAVDVTAQGPATIRELANVLGGELILAMGGGQFDLRIGLPRLVGAAEAAARLDAGRRAGTAVALQAEHLGAVLSLCWGAS